MKQIKFLGVLFFFAILLIGCKNSSNVKVTSFEKIELTDAEDEWVSIWNGKDLLAGIHISIVLFLVLTKPRRVIWA